METKGSSLFWPIFFLLAALALVFGASGSVHPIVVFFSGWVVVLLGGVLVRVGSVWWWLYNEFEKDKAKAEALALDEKIMEKFSQMRAQQILDNQEEVLRRIDEVLSPNPSLKLWYYRRRAGQQALRYLLADLQEFGFAKKYIAEEGDLEDQLRQEKYNAKILKYRKELIEKYNLSPFERRTVDKIFREVVDITPEPAKEDNGSRLPRKGS